MHRQKLRSLTKVFKILPSNQAVFLNHKKNLSSYNKPAVVLGIETSFDDTGMAIVDSTGKILGESLNSQMVHHLGLGGLNPPVARDLHIENIDKVYQDCLRSANMELKDIDAIAVTVEPGILLSLQIGRDYALNLSKLANKPVIPIHHMQAHALTARMIEKVDFPFLTLLISGAHCILALVLSVDEFKILGETIDDAPGEAFDKTARRMKLINIFEYNQISGGNAIELAAQKATNFNEFEFPSILTRDRHCNFSFSGLKTKAQNHIKSQEVKYSISGPDVIPNYSNLCAGFLLAVARHLCQRTQRAIEFIERKNLIPVEKKTLVVSGGVAANNFIANSLKKVCLETGFKFIRPPSKLCTDNGIMIAWNGVEKYLTDKGVVRDRNQIEKIDIAYKSPMGENWKDIVEKEYIKPKWVKLKFNELIEQ